MSQDFPSHTITAQPSTDIWKKPPSHDAFNAPYKVYTTSKLSAFLSAQLSFTATYTHRYDQSGLLLLLEHPSRERKWVKTGVELENGTVLLSVVGCDRWADWSVMPLPASKGADIVPAVRSGKQKITIQVQREPEPTGKGLWIYYLDDEGTKWPLRENAWFFADEDDEAWTLSVCAAVARPGPDGGELEAKFEGGSVRLKD